MVEKLAKGGYQGQVNYVVRANGEELHHLISLVPNIWKTLNFFSKVDHRRVRIQNNLQFWVDDVQFWAIVDQRLQSAEGLNTLFRPSNLLLFCFVGYANNGM